MLMKQESWGNAAITASNLSELELMLGGLTGAVRDAEQSVTHAHRSGDGFLQMAYRTTLADALHQAGSRPDAGNRFREAEEMQAKSQPRYPLLYSLWGFRYCDLLLAASERAAWQRIAGFRPVGNSAEDAGASLLQTCRDVAQRAAQTLRWIEGKLAPLDEANDHLTLGRAALYASLLDPSAMGNRQSVDEHLQSAVAGLRRAATMDHLPRGLLTRAWLSILKGETDGARADLDEAWEMAERGPMPLHMADILLHRARLFHTVTPYPWESPHANLGAARRLIERCGYWRRKEELEDADEAAKDW